ncbi:hypothetical protein QTP88_021400 [Uroleucon formosanum]
MKFMTECGDYRIDSKSRRKILKLTDGGRPLLSIGLRWPRSSKSAATKTAVGATRVIAVYSFLSGVRQHGPHKDSMRRLMLLGRRRRHRSLSVVRHRRCTEATSASARMSYCCDGISPLRLSSSFAGAVAVAAVAIVFLIVGAYSLDDVEN